MFCLVREFLEFFNLQFTISVYEPESYLDSIGEYEGRQKVAKDLGLDNTEESTVPLLQQLLKIAQTKSKVLDINLNLNGNHNGSFKDDSLKLDSSYKKTESCNSISKNSNNNSLSQEKTSKNEQLENKSLNATFDINSPTVVFNSTRRTNNPNYKDRQDTIGEEEDDTIENPNKTADIPKCSLNCTLIQEESNKFNNLSVEKNGSFNATYDLNSPTVNLSKDANNVGIPVPKFLKDIKEDDTYEDTSSIAEDSETLDKSVSLNASENVENDVPLKNTSSSDNSIQISLKISSLTKPEVDKPKLSPQRPKGSLSSLSDLPPLPLNKTRANSDILPSMYSKDFKNKSNLKELDKMFDMEADYEEDFMYSNELSLNSPSQSKNILSEPSFNSNKSDLEMLNSINKKDSKSSSKAISDVGKSVLKPIQTNCSSLVKTGDHSNNSSISEYATSESVNSAQ